MSDESPPPSGRTPTLSLSQKEGGGRWGLTTHRASLSISSEVDEAVAEALLGQDVLRVAGVGLDLLAQVGHVEAHVVLLLPVLPAPDACEQRLGRHDAARIRDELVEQA